MAFDWLKRLFGNPAGNTLQQQVDTEARAERIRRRETAGTGSLFGEHAYSTPGAAEAESRVESIGGFGTLIAGFGAMKGIGQLAEYLQHGRPWFDQLNLMAAGLEADDRQQAVRSALEQLSPESTEELNRRLSNRIGEDGDNASHIARLLGEANGFERLIQELLPGESNAQPSPWTLPNAAPEVVQVNALDAMRDAMIRDLARTLIPALTQARQIADDGEPPEFDS